MLARGGDECARWAKTHSVLPVGRPISRRLATSSATCPGSCFDTPEEEAAGAEAAGAAVAGGAFLREALPMFRRPTSLRRWRVLPRGRVRGGAAAGKEPGRLVKGRIRWGTTTTTRNGRRVTSFGRPCAPPERPVGERAAAPPRPRRPAAPTLVRVRRLVLGLGLGLGRVRGEAADSSTPRRPR